MTQNNSVNRERSVMASLNCVGYSNAQAFEQIQPFVIQISEKR